MSIKSEKVSTTLDPLDAKKYVRMAQGLNVDFWNHLRAESVISKPFYFELISHSTPAKLQTFFEEMQMKTIRGDQIACGIFPLPA